MEPIEQVKLEEKIKEKKIEQTGVQAFWELVRFAIIALIVVIPIRMFIAEPFIVSGSSMVPTFENGDYLIIDKISYALSAPKRDDVAVFIYPDPNPQNSKKYFIKRIIGLPNETVDIKGNDVTITNGTHTQGFKLNQPFVKNVADNNTHFVLKSDEYFVMGDNRSASSDSRYWGAVKKNLLTGRPFLRLWPINKIDILPGNYTQVE